MLYEQPTTRIILYELQQETRQITYCKPTCSMTHNQVVVTTQEAVEWHYGLPQTPTKTPRAGVGEVPRLAGGGQCLAGHEARGLVGPRQRRVAPGEREGPLWATVICEVAQVKSQVCTFDPN